jgi:hypothetical protein
MRPLAMALAVALTTIGCASASHAPVGTNTNRGSAIVAQSGRLFEFHSDAWVGLHHFLYNVARARRGLSAAGQAVSDTIGLGARTASERAAWNEALDYYTASGLADRDAVVDTLLLTITNRLGAAGGAPSLRNTGLDPRLVAVLESAASVYRAVWWPRHDAANRAWVASILPLVARYGDTLAAGIAHAFDTSWPSTPIRVDVAPYANWAGAYATGPPPHVTMSSFDGGYKDVRGLEMLFHEASHTIADSLAPVLRELAAASGKPAPFGVLHPIIFFTAGELTRRLVTGYTPFAESAGMWRGRMGAYLPAIQRHWLPHLDRRSTLREGLRAIIADL